MMVGSPMAFDIIAFSDSITRAISPPDATCDTGLISVLELALKRNTTLSTPVADNSPAEMSTLKRTFGIPSGTRSFEMSSSTSAAALRRSDVRTSAFF